MSANRKTEPREVYARCARLFLSGLDERLQRFFEAVDNSLFDMAEKAESNLLQTHYFDGMRQTRKAREAVDARFTDALRDRLDGFRKGKSTTDQPAEQPVQITEDNMALVDEAELEQKLAVSDMVAKGENRYSRPLFALNQRLAASLRTPAPDESSSPMGPAQICAAMQDATALYGIELPVLIVIYKLFDREVLETLGPLYDAINDEFIAANVLPQLRARAVTGGGSSGAKPAPAAADNDPASAAEPEVPRYQGTEETPRFDQGAAVASTAAHPAPAAGGSAPGAIEPDPAEQQVLESLLNMLSARRGPARAPAGPVAGQRELLNALTILQAQATAEPVADVKGLLLDEVSRMSDACEVEAAADDEDCIDLVAMMFEFILADRNLPPALQVVLSRLQIPYIKVALLDRKLFASRRHPARQLLDELADASVGWTANTDRGQQLYQKIERIVDQVVEDFDDDLSLFQSLRDELDQFVSKYRKRSEIAEKRTAETAEGQQRLQKARRQAVDALASRLADRELPTLVDELLKKPWANVLVLTQLRHGADSDRYQQACEFIDDLAWTCEPKSTAKEVSRLQSMLPGLSARLRDGLEMVAYHEDDIARVFRDLKALYKSMVNAQFRDKVTVDGMPSPPPATLELAEAVKPVKLPISGAAKPDDEVFTHLEPAPPEIPLEALEADLVAQVEAFQTNSWFEFNTEDGDRMRAKLSWKSPITGNYLFVDQKGIKVADKSIGELAKDLASGEAVALETVPLFDRALEAIGNRLSAEPGTASEAHDR